MIPQGYETRYLVLYQCSLIYQGTPTKRQRSDLFNVRVKRLYIYYQSNHSR